VRLDATRLKPARQPKAVAAGFEGKRNPRDSAAGPAASVPFALRSSSFWRWLRCPLRPGKRRVNPIPVGFTPTPAGALLSCSDQGNERRLHRLKRECLRDGGGQP
jgi:hypothetical protein